MLGLNGRRGFGAAHQARVRCMPARHGAPLRLIVPGWYGMASVKWLTEIDVSATPFEGRYQTESYVYEHDGDPRVEPVTLQRVRAVIVNGRRIE